MTQATSIPAWLSALGPTLLVVVGGGLGWLVKQRIESLRAVEEQLRSERREIYLRILDPFIKMLSDTDRSEEFARVILLPEFKEGLFQLILIGSDDVVRAYNHQMQAMYRMEASGGMDSREIMLNFGSLLLAVRRSVGNKRTKLKPEDTLRWLIRDLDAMLRGQTDSATD